MPDVLDTHIATGQLDISETFVIPTTSFHSHAIGFSLSQGNDAVRVFIHRTNAKIAVYQKDDQKLIGESQPVDQGRGQLLEVTGLKTGGV